MVSVTSQIAVALAQSTSLTKREMRSAAAAGASAARSKNKPNATQVFAFMMIDCPEKADRWSGLRLGGGSPWKVLFE